MTLLEAIVTLRDPTAHQGTRARATTLILRRLQGLVHATGACGDHDADDMVQDALVKLLRGSGRLTSTQDGGPVSYLKRTLRSVCVDAHRRRDARGGARAVSLDDELRGAPEPAAGPETDADSRLVVRDLVAAERYLFDDLASQAAHRCASQWRAGRAEQFEMLRALLSGHRSRAELVEERRQAAPATTEGAAMEWVTKRVQRGREHLADARRLNRAEEPPGLTSTLDRLFAALYARSLGRDEP